MASTANMEPELIPGLRMSTLAHMVHTLMEDAERVLCEDLLFSNTTACLSKARPRVLGDDSRNTKRGYSMADIPRATLVEAGVFHDVRANLAASGLAPRVLVPDGGGAWTEAARRCYCDRLHLFLEYLLVLILLTGGQPDQGAQYNERPYELVCLSHSNARGAARSIRIMGGQIMIITSDAHAREGLRIRFLESRVSTLLVLYLVSVRPFFKKLEPRHPLCSGVMLFASNAGVWETHQYNHILERESSRRIGKPLSVNDVTQIYIRGRKFA